MCRPTSAITVDVTPMQVIRRLAGKEADWVHESKLPLWLVKTFEERARRLAEDKSVAAAHQVARGLLPAFDE